jgi:hypothetical protein
MKLGSQKISKNEEKLIKICLSFMMLSLFWIFVVENQFDFDGSSSSKKIRIGKIDHKENDVRLKHRESWSWTQGKKNQAISKGDSIFVGLKSVATLQFKGKSQYFINENTLVTFEDVERNPILNLLDGKFNINLQEDIKIKVGNEIFDLKGKDAKIEIKASSFGNHKTEIKIINGEVLLKRPNHKMARLTPREVMKFDTPAISKNPPIEKPILTPIETTREIAAVETILPEAILPNLNMAKPILETNNNSEIKYYWKLEDLYSTAELPIRERLVAPKKVNFNYLLNWKSSNPMDRPVNSVSKNYGVLNCPDNQSVDEFEVEIEQYKLNSVCIGINQWKISYDKETWSESSSFFVTPTLRSNFSVQMQAPSKPFVLDQKVVQVQIPLQTGEKALGFLIQSSSSLAFAEIHPKLEWMASNNLNLSFTKAGTYYYRIRAVDNLHQISEWSQTLLIQVIKPKPIEPETPRLAKKSKIENKVAEQEPIQELSKNRSPNEDENVAEGHSQPSELQTTTTLGKYEGENDFPNSLYDSTHISFQPMAWVMQSTTQAFNNIPWSAATGIALHAIRWWKELGLEGTIKSKAFGIAESGTPTSLHQQEMRIHHRWSTGFPFGMSRELRVSLFSGIENNQNSSPYFTSAYNLLKVGSLIEFPWRSKWSAGGEFVYGLAADHSFKSEISGHLNYFFQKKFSFGVGYRVHLFQALSPANSPDGLLPYREGYTEGYSIMNYYF